MDDSVQWIDLFSGVAPFGNIGKGEKVACDRNTGSGQSHITQIPTHITTSKSVFNNFTHKLRILSKTKKVKNNNSDKRSIPKIESTPHPKNCLLYTSPSPRD